MKFVVFLFLCISGFCQDRMIDYDVTNVMTDLNKSLEEYIVALKAATNYSKREQLVLETRSKHSKSAAKFMSTLARQKGAQSLEALHMYQFFATKHYLFDMVFRLNLQAIEILQKKMDTMSYEELEQHIDKGSTMSYAQFESYIKTM